MNNSLKLKTLLKLAALQKDSSDIFELYGFIVLAAEDKKYAEVVEIFKEKFPQENINKIYAVAKQYQNAFKGHPDLYLENITNLTNLNQVLDLVKSQGSQSTSNKETIINKLIKENPGIADKVKALGETSVKAKYYPWIISVLNNRDSIQDIAKLVYFYDKNNLPRELESFSEVNELKKYLDKELLKPLEDEDKDDPSDIIDHDYLVYKNESHALNPKYTDYIYESENFMVVLSGTVPSSQYWGSGTIWCTSKARSNLFDSITGDKGLFLFYIITKKPEIYKNDKEKKKICVGYKIGSDNKPVLTRENNATVNAGNNNISKEDIIKYLGSEANKIFEAMNYRMTSNPKNKYNEFINILNPEEYRNQLKYLNPDDIVDLNNRLENKDYLDPDLLKEMLKSKAITKPFVFLTDEGKEFSNLRKDETLLDSAFENLIDKDIKNIFNSAILEKYGYKKYFNDDGWIEKCINSLKNNAPDALEDSIRNIKSYMMLGNSKINKLLNKLEDKQLKEEFKDSYAASKPEKFLKLHNIQYLIEQNSERVKTAIKNIAETNPMNLLGTYYYTKKNEEIIHDFINKNFPNNLFDYAANKLITKNPTDLIFIDSEAIRDGTKGNIEWVKKALISLLEKEDYVAYIDRIFYSYYNMYRELRYSPEMMPYNIRAIEGLIEKEPYKFFQLFIYKNIEYEKFIKNAFIKINEKKPELVKILLATLEEKYKNIIGYDLIAEISASSSIRAANKFVEEGGYEEYLQSNFHKDPRFKDLTDIVAQKCKPKHFFWNGLHNIPEYKNLAMKKIKEIDISIDGCTTASETVDFFTAIGLDKPPYKNEFIELLTNVAGGCPEEFFRKNFQTNPEYKDISIIAAEKYIEESKEFSHKREFFEIAKNILRKNSIDDEYDIQEEFESGRRPFGITRGKLKRLESALNKIGCRSDRLSRLIKII